MILGPFGILAFQPADLRPCKAPSTESSNIPAVPSRQNLQLLVSQGPLCDLRVLSIKSPALISPAPDHHASSTPDFPSPNALNLATNPCALNLNAPNRRSALKSSVKRLG